VPTITSTPTRRDRQAHRDLDGDIDRDRDRDDSLFRQYRASGDRRVRNQLIHQHRWLAIHCAKRFADKGEPLDDLVQVAMLGVLKAVERFDPDYGAAFATFAVPTIVGELRRHFRDTTWAVHVPRRARDLQHTVKVAVDELGQLLGRSPTVGEIAGQAGVCQEDVLDALEAARCYRNAPLESGSDDTAGEIADIAALGEDERGLDAVEATSTVEQLLTVLPPRERRIVELRYLQGHTQSRIAELVGVSQVQVSRLLRRSLAVMRSSLEDVDGTCAV
jgi:RNA polymerase sigma-B factor